MEKARKGRDNFTQAVLKILYRRAGGKCCRCGAATFGPVKNHPLQSVNIGKGLPSSKLAAATVCCVYIYRGSHCRGSCRGPPL